MIHILNSLISCNIFVISLAEIKFQRKAPKKKDRIQRYQSTQLCRSKAMKKDETIMTDTSGQFKIVRENLRSLA